MTDEEMADKYVSSQRYANIFNFGENTVDLSLLKRGVFLDGLKAGRPKWHKVADGDLPRQDGHTCFSIKVLANNKKWVYYQFGVAKWFCGNKEVKVKAWCEIPKYTEE